MRHPGAGKSFDPSGTHGSAALQELLRKWDVENILQEEVERAIAERDQTKFWNDHHTYQYTTETPGTESSRLDR